MTPGVVETCARAWPKSVEVPEPYRQACRLLGLSNRPRIVLAAGYAAGTAGSLVGMGVVALAGGPSVAIAGLAILLFSSSIALAVRYGVPFVARARRLRILGAAPSLVTMLTLGATLWGSTERAVEFATAASEQSLADYLDRHARRSAGTPRSGLSTFVQQWGDEFPALATAVERIERATIAPPGERPSILASARQCVLEGTRAEMSEFAADLRAPATGLYAFGVLLPLALVSLLPAANAAGVPVPTTLLVAVYGVVLPAALCVASGWLLGQRPVAFPPEPVPRSHPDVPEGRWRAVAAGLGVGGAAGALSHSLGLGWGIPIAALGTGVGATLVVHFHPAVQVRENVTAVESGLPDALSAIGTRVERGQSVEAALDDVAEEQSGPLATLLHRGVRRQAILGVDVERAFRGQHGALAAVPSHRTRQAATLLGAAAEIGPPAAESVSAMGKHLSDLQRIEQELRRDLAQVTGTLSNTAALFGPLVGGATVALGETMGTAGPLGGPAPERVGLVVGWYVLVLAVVLTALSAGLRGGFDRVRVGHRVGVALMSATATFFTAVFATRLVV